MSLFKDSTPLPLGAGVQELFTYTRPLRVHLQSERQRVSEPKSTDSHCHGLCRCTLRGLPGSPTLVVTVFKISKLFDGVGGEIRGWHFQSMIQALTSCPLQEAFHSNSPIVHKPAANLASFLVIVTLESYFLSSHTTLPFSAVFRVAAFPRSIYLLRLVNWTEVTGSRQS